MGCCTGVYLDKVNELILKAQKNQLTKAEFLILKDLDLAELRGYEQAKELTIDLLKKWLVKYKFKNWNKHQTSLRKIGQIVTAKEKEDRAKEIADKLANNKIWKSHGIPINIETLEQELKLKIEDYSGNKQKRNLIRSYYVLLSDFVNTNNFHIYFRSDKKPGLKMELKTIKSLRKVLKEKSKSFKDDKTLEAFEKASMEFEEMVKSGLVKKRGNTLMPIDKKHLSIIPINSNLNK